MCFKDLLCRSTRSQNYCRSEEQNNGRNGPLGAGEVAEGLQALIALTEDLRSVPSIHALTTVCNSSSRDQTPSSGLLGHCTYMVHIKISRQE